MARAVDAAVALVGRITVDHVQCALEALALQLGDALGLAACSAWMAPLSLQVPSLSPLHAVTETNLLMCRSDRLMCMPLEMHVRAKAVLQNMYSINEA